MNAQDGSAEWAVPEMADPGGRCVGLSSIENIDNIVYIFLL
jgi:hypothetical protein